MNPRNEVFLDPDFSVTHPEGVIYRLAFNEEGDLGLITSYQKVAQDLIFVGVSLGESTPWVSKTPLAVKKELHPKFLTQASHVLNEAYKNQLRSPDILHTLIKKILGGQDPEVPYVKGSLEDVGEDIFGARSDGFGNDPKQLKFNFEDFLNEFNIVPDEESSEEE